MKNISQDQLKDLLSYEPDTGIFLWKKKLNRRIVVGSQAGFLIKGYACIRINKQNFYAHRLAWLYVYGYFPEQEVDHINGVKNQNNIKNLRLADKSQNLFNIGPRRNNKSGFKNVSWCEKNQKWRVCISIHNKFIHIGYFEDKENAKNAAIKAQIRYQKEFAWSKNAQM